MTANEQPVPGTGKILFLHIAKTAGTSVVEFFRHLLPPGSVLSHGDFLQHSRGGPLPQALLDRYRFVSGHFGYSHLAPYLSQAYSFTFLRDPVDRALSFYKFCLHPDMQDRFAVARAANALGIDGFMCSQLPEVVEMLDNQQTWQLARMYWHEDREALAELSDEELLTLARAHLQELSHAGLTETFDRDFRTILQDLQISQEPPPRRALRTPSPLTRDQLKPSTLRMLQERSSLDYQLYDWLRASSAHSTSRPDGESA